MAARLVSTGDIHTGLELSRTEVLRGLRNCGYLTDQSVTALLNREEEERRKEVIFHLRSGTVCAHQPDLCLYRLDSNLRGLLADWAERLSERNDAILSGTRKSRY